MSLQKLIANYADYNVWANQQSVNWLSTKPIELLNQEVPSSYSTILKTLNHIWAVEEYWFAIITQKTDFENRYFVENLDKDEIFKGLISRSTLLADEIKLFSEVELLKKIKVVSPWLEADQSRYEYLLQLVNHATYHRGQIVTIGRNVGITDAPNTDYVFFNIANK